MEIPCRVIFVMGVLTGRQIRSARNTTWRVAGQGRRDERGETSPVQPCQPLLEQEMGASWQQGPPYLTEIRNLNH